MNKEIQNEQELEKVSEDKNGIVTWIKAHKKQLLQMIHLYVES